MRAVYKSSKAYLHLSRDEVLNTVMAYSAPNTVRDYRYSGVDEKTGNRNSVNLLKPVSCVGTITYISDPLSPRFYTFSEGEKHNQLTLTDPTDIRCMRAYIKRRGERDDLIREILFDGDEAELEVREPVAVPKEPVEAKEPQEEPTEWDLKYSSMLRRR